MSKVRFTEHDVTSNVERRGGRKAGDWSAVHSQAGQRGSETFLFIGFVEQEDEEANTGSHLKLIVDAFIQQLPNCVNRDLIDKVRTARKSLLCESSSHKIQRKMCVLAKALIVVFLLKAAMDFCMNMNTKANRRKLVRALFTVPRQRLGSCDL